MSLVSIIACCVRSKKEVPKDACVLEDIKSPVLVVVGRQEFQPRSLQLLGSYEDFPIYNVVPHTMIFNGLEVTAGEWKAAKAGGNAL